MDPYVQFTIDRVLAKRGHFLQSSANHEPLESDAQRLRDAHFEQIVRTSAHRKMFSQELAVDSPDLRAFRPIDRLLKQHSGKSRPCSTTTADSKWTIDLRLLGLKNEKVVEVQRFIQNGLNIIKQQTTSAFDLHSLLLKPIQRVLKYPLLLQELIKVCTLLA